ncbi:MAG: hypothetical protein EOO09_02675 [Chitinophagaceae bacterium]|nr:MAG: hypothetical protein EOO09_02675 [Chitinophagaceae bacterium]
MDDKKYSKEHPPKDSPENTDPQEKMEGPISSLVQNVKETGEENDKNVSKEEADKEKDKNK